MSKLSVLMAVYNRELPEHLDQSLASIAAQTWPADEVLIVKDGPLGDELEEVIDHHAAQLPMRTLQIPTNQGLGPALRAGVETCQFDLIARMDSDDICVPDRLERQMRFLNDHPEVDVLGASITEFDSDPECCKSVRRLPSDHVSIRSIAKFRCPVNHMTVVYRKAAVLSAGNYGLKGMEDYDLWVRMLVQGARFHNLDEVLVYARCGNGLQGRRGGLAYVGREIDLFWSFRKIGFLTTFEFLQSILPRLPVRLLPASFRARVYGASLRTQTPTVKN